MTKAKTEVKPVTLPEQGKTYTRKQALVVPVLSIKALKPGDTLAIIAAGEIQSKPATNDDGTPKLDKKNKEAFIHTLRALNIETGELGEMVLPFLLHKALKDAGKLEGRAFEFVKGEEEKNKTTKWTAWEIEVPQ